MFEYKHKKSERGYMDEFVLNILPDYKEKLEVIKHILKNCPWESEDVLRKMDLNDLKNYLIIG